MTSEAIDCQVEVYQPHGRWNPYTNRQEIIEEICERLELGEALVRICKDSRLPSAAAVVEWQQSDPLIGERIARAREVGEDNIAANMRSVARGEEGYATGDVQRDKLIIDTDFKLLAKFNPKRWGESTQLRHADADGQKLDTAPLVSELLSLMGPGVANTVSAPTASATDGRVIKAELMPDTYEPRPAYRPRRAHDVDDLV